MTQGDMPHRGDCGPALENDPFISVIIPFCDDPDLPHLRARLDEICEELSSLSSAEILVAEGIANKAHEAPPWKWQSIRHLQFPNDAEAFSIAAARNLGAQQAVGRLLVFLDVDLRVAPDFWQRLVQFCRASGVGEFKKRYFCVPCLYLTESGTEEFVRAAPDTRTMAVLLRWLHGDTSAVRLMAPCSSFVVVDRLHYLALGGHDGEFVGHGFEDFDLHHRLASEASVLVRPEDYYRDYLDWENPEYRGFRSMFSLVGRCALFTNLVAVHMWHSRPKHLAFYRAKEDNQTRLEKAMRSFDVGAAGPSPLAAREAGGATFMFLGEPGSNSARTIRDVVPLLGTPVFVDERQFIDGAGALNVGELQRVLSGNRIDKILFPNPYRNTARQALYTWCRKNRFPYLVFERGALPNSWFFDPQGFNADSRSYSRENWDRPLTAEEQERVGRYTTECLAGHETLEPQGPRLGAAGLARKLGIAGKKILFVPLQRPSDTVTVHMAGAAGGVARFLHAVDQCAHRLMSDGWVVLCKRHPYERAAPALLHARYVEPDTHVLDLVSLADSVALMNSSVGLYAMMMAKPCLVCSSAFFSFRGINETITSLDVAEMSDRVRSGMTVNMEAVGRFIHFLVAEFYSFGCADYTSWQDADGSSRKAATKIDFFELRIPGVPWRVSRRDLLTKADPTAPLYERFRHSVSLNPF